MKVSTKKVNKVRYTNDHKMLFAAIFQGTNDINEDGNIVVDGKVWDFNDPTVQLFIRKARQLKIEITQLIEKETRVLFGK